MIITEVFSCPPAIATTTTKICEAGVCLGDYPNAAVWDLLGRSGDSEVSYRGLV